MTVLISILSLLFISAPEPEYLSAFTQGNITYCDDINSTCMFQYIEMRIEQHNDDYEILINDKPVDDKFTSLSNYVISSIEILKAGYSDTIAVMGNDSVIIDSGTLNRIVFYSNDIHHEFIADSLSF